jgi:RNA polymerase sigma-32 factor
MTRTATPHVHRTDLPVILPSMGNINSYISAAQKMPFLDAQDEVVLFVRIRENGDEQALNRLSAAHLRLVISLARVFRGYGLPEEDLIQAGNLGLLKAIKAFDLSMGARLATYASHYINSEIRTYVMHNSRIVRTATTKSQRKLFFNLRSMKMEFKQKQDPVEGQTHRDTLTPEQIKHVAKILNVDEVDVIEMEARLMGGDTPLNGGVFDDDSMAGMGYEFLGSVQDDPTEVMDRKARAQMSTIGVSDAMEALDDRSRRIIEARWLDVNDDGNGMTLHQLAAEFGVSAERVRQIEVRALLKMREHMSANTTMVC